MSLAPTELLHYQSGATLQELCTHKTNSAESAILGPFGYRPSMPQSLSKVVIHIIFSTKDRHPWLDASVRPQMYAYLATICRDAGAEVFRIGGVADHVHAVTTLQRTLSQADMLERAEEEVLKMD